MQPELKRKEILERVKHVPALPPVSVEIVRVLQNPDADLNQVVRLAEHDPGLTSNLLRAANSAFFSTAKGVHSVREAVQRLGLKWVYQAVVSTSVAPLAQQGVSGYDMPPGGLLAHSIAVAVGTEQIAKALKLEPPEYAFTAGLLHDLGKIVMGTFLEIDALAINALVCEKEIPFEEAERVLLGIDHAEAGAALLEAWKLPPAITEVVRWHHHPENFTGESLVVDLVHMADNISMLSGVGLGLDGLHYTPSRKVATRLRMSPSVTETVVCRMLCKLEEWQGLLGSVSTGGRS
jgi:putative nucleotidyltransferase with HDIG domain